MKKFFFPHDHKIAHMKHLDGIRGFAILIVLLGHAGEWFFLHPLLDFTHFSQVGVFLFFILSGYLLDKQIVEVLIRGKSGHEYWLNYLFRRFLRIFPMLFLSLLFYYILNKTIVETFIFEISDIWQHLTLSVARSFYWSIPVEFHYYLISPVLLIIFYSIFKWSLKPSLLLIIGLILLSLFVGSRFGHVRLSTLQFISLFLTGTTIVLLERFAPLKLNYNFNYLAALSIFGIFLMQPFYWKYFLNVEWYLGYNIKLLVYAFLLGTIFLAIHQTNGLLRKIAEWKFFRFFGSISFSLYLLHWSCGLIINKYSSGAVLVDVVIYIALSVILASITYCLVEYPLSKIYIKIFFRKRKGNAQEQMII